MSSPIERLIEFRQMGVPAIAIQQKVRQGDNEWWESIPLAPVWESVSPTARERRLEDFDLDTVKIVPGDGEPNEDPAYVNKISYIDEPFTVLDNRLPSSLSRAELSKITKGFRDRASAAQGSGDDYVPVTIRVVFELMSIIDMLKGPNDAA